MTLPIAVRIEKFVYAKIMELSAFKYDWSSACKELGLNDLNEVDTAAATICMAKLQMKLLATLNEVLLQMVEYKEEEPKNA